MNEQYTMDYLVKFKTHIKLQKHKTFLFYLFIYFFHKTFLKY